MVFRVYSGDKVVSEFIKLCSNISKAHLFPANTSKEMFLLFAILNVVTLSVASEQDTAGFFNVGIDVRNNRGLFKPGESFNKPPLHNSTYFDKEDNLLRNKYYDESKSKKKLRKPPKRTVQKIIKKNKVKTRKLYLFPATLTPTLASKADDEYTRRAMSTTENNSKRRPRKNSKYVRYPMPFQRLQRRDGSHTRFRREERDVYILKDFDEMEFLSNEKDHDKVLAHVQKHW